MTDKTSKQDQAIVFRSRINHFYNLLEEEMRYFRDPTFEDMENIWGDIMYSLQKFERPALSIAWNEFNRDNVLPREGLH